MGGSSGVAGSMALRRSRMTLTSGVRVRPVPTGGTRGKRAREKKLTRLGHHPDQPDGLEGQQRLNRRELGEVWEIAGTRKNRAQVFSWLCEQIADTDNDLVDLCSMEGAPRLSQVASWQSLNPEWKMALAEAEKIAAMRRVNMAKQVARRAEGAAQAAGSKLYVDTLLWEASKLDRRFAEKHIVVDETEPLGRVQEDALVQQFMAAVLAQPELIKSMAPQIKEILPPEAAEQLERLARAQIEAESMDGEIL